MKILIIAGNREQRAKERHEDEYRQELQHLADQADRKELEQRNKAEATTYYRDMLMAQIEAAQLKKKRCLYVYMYISIYIYICKITYIYI
jgi:hypothetical protein